MNVFQAIDNNNVVIEGIFSGQKPTTLEGAAQAWFAGFSADFSEFSEEQLKENWIEQETAKIAAQYNAPVEVAHQEALSRLNQSKA